jgi:hypothetical protein
MQKLLKTREAKTMFQEHHGLYNMHTSPEKVDCEFHLWRLVFSLDDSLARSHLSLSDYCNAAGPDPIKMLYSKILIFSY